MFCLSWERWIISMRRRWETASYAFKMSNVMAIVLRGSCCWLKPVTTLAEIWKSASVWSRAERREFQEPLRWLGGVAAPGSLMPGRAVTSGGRRRSCFEGRSISWCPCIEDWGYDWVLPNFRDVNSGNWEVEELRQKGHAVQFLMVKAEHGEPIN